MEVMRSKGLLTCPQKSNSRRLRAGGRRAFWKSKPVVAGHAGGIPLQFPAGYEDYLVGKRGRLRCQGHIPASNTGTLPKAFGRAGQAKIRTEFLLPRLIRDELPAHQGRDRLAA